MFRHTEMGAKVMADPAGAAEELTAIMRAHGSHMGDVADVVGCHRDTLADWFDKLEAAGYPVVGRGSAKKGRKMKQKKAVVLCVRRRRRRTQAQLAG